MSKMKEWLLDKQINGDDGTGHCDFEMTQCDFCGEWYEYESEGKDNE